MYDRNFEKSRSKTIPDTIKSLLRASLFSMPLDDSVDDENSSSEFQRVSRIHVFICTLVISKLDCRRCTVYTQRSRFQPGRRRPTHEQSRSFTGERVLTFLNFTPRIGPGDRNSWNSYERAGYLIGKQLGYSRALRFYRRVNFVQAAIIASACSPRRIEQFVKIIS